MLQTRRILCLIHLEADEHPALTQALMMAEACRARLHVAPHPSPSGSLEGQPGVPTASRFGLSTGGQRSREAVSSPAQRDVVPHSVSTPSPNDRLRDIVGEWTSRVPMPLQDVTIVDDRRLPTRAIPPVEALIDYTREASIDLVVLDTPPDRGPIPPLASEPTRQLVTDLSVPVFVVGHRTVQADASPASATAAPPTPRRILVPTDLSENSLSSLCHAEALAQDLGAELDVLHVINRPQYVALNAMDMLSLSDATLLERKARRRVGDQLKQSGGSSVSNIHIRHGDAATQIVQFASIHESDLVVMSTHGTIHRAHAPLGHVVERVLHRIARPVFLTRADGPTLVDLPASRSDGASSTPPRVSARPSTE